MEQATHQTFKVRFGLFEADLKTGELRRSGIRIRLQAQPFRVLSLLLEKPGEIVSRDELQQSLWGTGTVVDFDHSLGTAINKIRDALGDSADNPRFIETLARRGYRFIAPVSYDVPERAEILPAPPSTEIVVPDVPQPSKISRGLAYAAVIALIALAFLAGSHSISGRPAPFRIAQVTFSGRVSPGDTFLEDLPTTATDGARIYFPQITNGRAQLAEALIADGQTTTLSLPDEIVSPLICDISPDGSKLLIRNHVAAEAEQAVWVVPTLGGAARRISGILAHDATWTPDGRHILYANGDDLFMASEDGSGNRKFATVPGRAFWLRWSPNGATVRMTLLNPRNHTTSLWQVHSDGSGLHPLLPGWSSPASECCGSWTADGKLFIFQSSHNGESNIWSLRSAASLFGRAPQPVQLTNGPLNYQAPITARSGHSTFFIGADTRSELLRYDAASNTFSAYGDTLTSAHRVEFSRDRKWIAWISQDDNSLWRSRADGTERVQLTAAPMEVFLMHWSADDKQLLFMARLPGSLWQVYTIDADGSNLKPVYKENRNQSDPDWSPDGSQIVFGRVPALMGEVGQPKAIYLLDRASGQVSELPGSVGLFSPRWSPDGRYIAALSLDMNRLMLYDTVTRTWSVLLRQSAADPVWTHDGKTLFFHNYVQKSQTIYRVRVPDGQVERIADLRDMRFADAVDYQFAGLAPGDAPLVSARMSTANIYSVRLDKR